MLRKGHDLALGIRNEAQLADESPVEARAKSPRFYLAIFKKGSPIEMTALKILLAIVGSVKLRRVHSPNKCRTLLESATESMFSGYKVC